jgi:hypothetical protein
MATMGFAPPLRWLNAGQAAMPLYTMPVWGDAAGGVSGRSAAHVGARHTPLGAHMMIGAGFALASALLFAFGTVALRP